MKSHFILAKYNTKSKELLENLLSSSNEDLAKIEYLGKIDKRKENISHPPSKKYKEK